MITCNTARDALALNASTTDEAVSDHIAQCADCAAYRRRSTAIDGLLQTEMRWQAPADLTLRLLAMAAAPMLMHQPAPRPRPKGWHVTVAYVAATLSVALSMVVGWQIIALLFGQVDLSATISQILAMPEQWLAWITQAQPDSRYVIDFFLKVRSQLLWLLLAAVLWAVLDKWNPSFSFRRQQQA